MNITTFILAFVLFVILTPNVLIRLPPKSGKYIVAATHAFIFILIWYIAHKYIWSFSEGAKKRKKRKKIKKATPKPKPPSPRPSR